MNALELNNIRKVIIAPSLVTASLDRPLENNFGLPAALSFDCLTADRRSPDCFVGMSTSLSNPTSGHYRHLHMERPQSSDTDRNDSPSRGAQNDANTGQPPSSALANSASADEQRDPAASMHQQRPTHPHGNNMLRNKQVSCRFYGTKKGCRSGAACPYLHVAPDAEEPGYRGETEKAPATNHVARAESSSPASRSRAAFTKPVSQAQKESPRNFQIGQITRRFRPKEETDQSGNTTLSFGMAPTDPDFPFDMAELLCLLHVPPDWPASGRPNLKVTNPDMPRGFQINVERGFDGLIDTALRDRRPVTLLSLMNSLDRNLERFLTAEKAPTIKIVANLGSRTETPPPAPLPTVNTKPLAAISRKPDIVVPTTVVYRPEERAQAEQTRRSETKQLEARLNRLPLYQKASDGLSYVVPLTLTKLEKLPFNLRNAKTVRLLVPTLYPLEKSSVEFAAVDGKEARAVEAGFRKWIQTSPHVTLMSQVNYLAHNMHVLVSTSLSEDAAEKQPNAEKSDILGDTVSAYDEQPVDDDHHGVNIADTDSPHLKVIPRPPEWLHPKPGPDSDFTTDSSEFDEELTEEDDEDDIEDGGAPVPESAGSLAPSPARGIALNLPGLELFGIELLETKLLCVTVKCERCKEYNDIKNIKPANEPNVVSPVHVESCRKCANTFNIAFRRELMHPTSHRAGYLDLDGCTAFDLLPSHFQPTCSECSTPFPAPGLVAVRGTSAVASCRECHRKMNFRIPEVKFMIVGPSALSHHRSTAPRKKVKENLGITVGQELPRRGRCAHYGKSYRWFRFSCCAKVFPCDRCHDAATDHPNEHANRMICGFCSREQTYRPEDCSHCRHVLVGKAGSGFWEGGKGTRDKVKMSRKDPRKYKRR